MGSKKKVQIQDRRQLTRRLIKIFIKGKNSFQSYFGRKKWFFL